MQGSAVQVAQSRSRALDVALQVALIVGASLFVGFCARISIPIPGTPVPLTVQNLGVLLVGLALGSRRGFATMILYLVEGAAGLPVFSPFGAPGLARLVGPTAGFLLAYPLVAGLTGYIFESGKATFARAARAAIAGELVLFGCGISWLYILTHSIAQALSFGLYWFTFAEIMKVMFAAGMVRSWHGLFSQSEQSQ
jgi:biotin transport system substrate-specific component